MEHKVDSIHNIYIKYNLCVEVSFLALVVLDERCLHSTAI